MNIIGLVFYLGRNGLAFRGHREGATAVDAHGNMADRGNFLEGMDLLSTHSYSIRERLAKGPQNQKYLHHDIQNELLHCASSIIRQQVAKEVSLAGCYSLSADETKDLSKVEQVAVSIRYVSDGGIQEEFIGFGAASDDLSAAGLTTVISAMLTVGIDINGMVGMAFDGASVMSGEHRGVQQQLREKQDVPKAIYVHCFAHRLNLVLSEVCQSVDRVRLALHTIQAVYVFFSGSTVQNAYQRHLADMGDEFKKYRIQSQSETRWYARCVAVTNILKVMPAVHDTLIEQSECHKDSKRRATASGLLLTVDTHLIINLSIMEWILNKVDILSRHLQAHDATFSAARNLINTLVEELAPLNPPHADPRFDGIWERAEAVIQESDLPAPPQRRVRRVRRTAAANAGQEGYIRNFEGPDDWRRIVFNPMLRALIAEIETRYALDNDGVLTGIDALNPQLHDSFLELDLLQPMAERFHIDCAPLRPQVETCKLMVAKMRADGHPAIASVDSLSEFYRFLIPHKDSLFCLYELAKIAVTLPISSAGCERSFSVMKRVKTWLRTTMTHERLSDCGILAMSRGRTKGLETEDGLNQVLDAFVTRGERRMDLIL